MDLSIFVRFSLYHFRFPPIPNDIRGLARISLNYPRHEIEAWRGFIFEFAHMAVILLDHCTPDTL